VSALVSYVLSPGGAVLLLAVSALWIWRRPQSAHARRFLLLVALAYAALSSYGISSLTGRLLVGGFRPFMPGDAGPGPAAIVVLGSGTFTARDWDDSRLPTLDPAAAMRTLEAYRVFKLTDAAWVISSGGLSRPSREEEPSGRTMRDTLINLGVPESRVLVETESRNTHEEAIIVKRMLQSIEVAQLILVTSDIHMRRSLGTFRAEGLDPIPAIARTPTPRLPPGGWLIPTRLGLDLADDVWHEILGLPYYFVRGWYR
jgi:uncharacterized SAM-binding protein YcdF (DUF218 family)